MLALHVEIGQCGSKGRQLVGYDGTRRESLFLEQFAHRFQSDHSVATGLNQDIQNFSLVVDRTPQI